MEKQAEIKPSDKVSLFVKAGWGFGGLADFYIMNTLIMLLMPIYNIRFGMDPMLLSIAIFIPRAIDAFTDPMMGNISDNTRCRYGRRRPYIALGAVVCALLLPLIWTPPFASDTGKFVYLVVLCVLYALAYTAYVVPYTALGFELTSDYDEKTRVLAWRMYLGLLGSIPAYWIYRLTRLDVFKNDEAIGAPFVCIGVSLFVLLTGLLPVITCRENLHIQSQPPIGIFRSLKETFKNKPFLILFVAYVIIICGIFTSQNFALYINIYHVCGGDKTAAGTMSALAGNANVFGAFLSLFLIAWISRRWEKRNAMLFGLFLGIVASLSLFVTLNSHPVGRYAQLLSFFIFGLGLQGCWLMVSTMTADICDEDELVTGRRREGIYGAVTGFALKMAMAVSALFGGALLKLSGYQSEGIQEAQNIDPQIITNMMYLFIGPQVGGFLFAAFLFFFYPIDRKRSHETRQKLEQRHNMVDSTTMSGEGPIPDPKPYQDH